MSKDTAVIVGKYYRPIDGLRGFACLFVLWFHSASLINITLEPNLEFIGIYRNISLIGATGVNLFFILSGFLITGILMDTCEMKGRFKKFYIRRSLRIFPLYYMFLCVVLLCFFVFLNDRDYSKWLTFIFYLQNWTGSFDFDHYKYVNHLWSLAVEEQFYIVWPVVFLAVYKKENPKPAIKLCFFTIFLSWYLYMFFVSKEQHFLAYMFTLSRMDGLALGALLSVLYVHYYDVLKSYMYLVKYIMIFSTCIMLSYLLWSEPYFIFLSYGVTMATIFYFALTWLVMMSAENTRLNRCLTKPLICYVGRISYGLYIFHVPVMELLLHWLQPLSIGFWQSHFILIFLGSSVSVICAHFSYKFFERPLVLLKDKYAPLRASL